MPKKKPFRIYYGRIVVLQDDLLTETEFPIRDAVQPGIPVNRYNHMWVVGNLVVDDPPGFLSGRLGYYPEEEPEVELDYDRDELSFVEVQLDRPHAIAAPFVLDYNTGALAFEDHPDIGPTGFVGHLVAVMNEAGGARFRGVLVHREEDYKSFVARVDRVVRVSYDVRRPNPHDREIFRRLKEDLYEANAEREKREYENPAGLDLPIPESADEPTENPLTAGIEMVEEGFGKGSGYTIDAEHEGRPMRYKYSPQRAASDFRDEEYGVPDDDRSRRAALVRWLKERRDWIVGPRENGDDG